MINNALERYVRLKGISLVLLAAVCWAIAGVLTQYLLELEFTVEWLVSVRLLVAGIVLLTITHVRLKINIWNVLKDKYDLIHLILFSIIGMLAAHYAYFYAIAFSNVATASVLYYLAPAIITCYVALRVKKVPTKTEIIAVFFAIIGTALLVTGGKFTSLSISGWALFWGLTSAVSMAFYTLQPHKLLAKWGSLLVIGWGMLLGGFFFSLFYRPWDFSGDWSFLPLTTVILTIILGTILPFTLYLISLDYIKPSETSVIACFEPLLIAVFSAIWLNINFGTLEWLGIILILSTVIILSIVKDASKSIDYSNAS